MSLYTAVRHPRAHARRSQDPGHADEASGFNERLAAWITARIGSMWTVYIAAAVTVIWMALGSKGVLGFDPYPYPFLLFLGNVAQLLLIFIILLGQQVLGRSADRRSTDTYEDAEAILVDCEQIQNHLMAQDTLLAGGTDLGAEHQELLAKASERIEAPPTTADEYVGFNGRLAAWLTSKVGHDDGLLRRADLPGRLDRRRPGARVRPVPVRVPAVPVQPAAAAADVRHHGRAAGDRALGGQARQRRPI